MQKDFNSNLMSFWLHEVAFLGYHPYPYSFSSHSYSCKILQLYVAARVRVDFDAVLSSTGAPLMKTVKKIINKK